MPDKEITLVCIGDLHVGSENAICPCPFKRMDGSTHDGNRQQKALYAAYEGLTKEWAKPDILVVNGDAIEGRARKESGVPCWTVNLTDQLRAAAELVKMWGAGVILVLDGTGYHVDADGCGSLENQLARDVGAKKIGRGEAYSANEVFYKVGGLTFHFAHHLAFGSGWFLTTPLAKEMVLAKLNASHKHKSDVEVRSHCHYFAGVEFTGQKAYLLPCWQLQTRYAFRKSAWLVPDIGAVRFKVSNGQLTTEKRFFRPDETRPRLHTYDEGSDNRENTRS